MDKLEEPDPLLEDSEPRPEPEQLEPEPEPEPELRSSHLLVESELDAARVNRDRVKARSAQSAHETRDD